MISDLYVLGFHFINLFMSLKMKTSDKTDALAQCPSKPISYLFLFRCLTVICLAPNKQRLKGKTFFEVCVAMLWILGFKFSSFNTCDHGIISRVEEIVEVLNEVAIYCAINN